MEQQEGQEMADELTADTPLPPLSLGAMETLLAALDPRLDGFGKGPSCLDDARAFLERLAQGARETGEEGSQAENEAMAAWLEIWRNAGGDRATLRLLVATVMAERLRSEAGKSE